ncbi:MAG TPA: glycosyltransferase family 4 protein [Candidatus Eisenbacteria bacterium]|nr:glycosyltransferase family 4 protein [Candidatus Eisenbacteria bacterium]
MSAGSRGRIALHVPDCYPIVSGGRIPLAGGIEVHALLLAIGLARRGFDVSVIACDYGQPDGLVVDGVRLIRTFRPRDGLRVLRFFHPRLSLTIGALRRADADVYVAQGAGMYAGLVCDVARAMRRPFVFMAAHEFDLQPTLPRIHGPRDRLWYRRALAGARSIVVQTERQRTLLRTSFGREGIVLMNPVDIPDQPADPAASRRVVWLATYKPSKRPEWFTRLAERHPELECVMGGVVPTPPLSEYDYQAALAVAGRCRNLEVNGTIPHERVGEFLRGAGLFAHSSPAEGFPNTFLEAWSCGLPTVTCFDPDGIIARERLGERQDTFEGWEAAVLRWIDDPPSRAEAGSRARTYARRVHGSGEILDRFADEMDRLVALRRGHRRGAG